jgi:hypothetical protein
MSSESASCVSDRSTYLANCQGPGKGGGRCNDGSHVDSDAAVCEVAAWGSSAATRPWIVGNFAWVSDCLPVPVSVFACLTPTLVFADGSGLQRRADAYRMAHNQ